jgi:hypothetical protein
MITFQISRRTIGHQTFFKLIEELKDKSCVIRIRLTSKKVVIPDAFMKVLWSGEAGILLQNESDKQFVAIEDVRTIASFEITHTVLNLKAEKEYFLR